MAASRRASALLATPPTAGGSPRETNSAVWSSTGPRLSPATRNCDRRILAGPSAQATHPRCFTWTGPSAAGACAAGARRTNCCITSCPAASCYRGPRGTAWTRASRRGKKRRKRRTRTTIPRRRKSRWTPRTTRTRCSKDTRATTTAEAVGTRGRRPSVSR